MIVNHVWSKNKSENILLKSRENESKNLDKVLYDLCSLSTDSNY